MHSMAAANGKRMTTRSAKLTPAPDGFQHASTNGPSYNGEASTQQSRASKIKAVPVTLSDEDRKSAELEAAMIYYKGLIELRLRRG